MALLLGALLAPGAQAYSQSYQTLAPSPVELTSVAADPGTGIIYAQENDGEAFFAYNPHTNAWVELAEAPIDSGNNGGATYLGGKIYTSYTENEDEIGVYDIALNSWSTLPNPLGEGTGDITTSNNEIYMVNERKFVKYNPATNFTTTLAEAPLFASAECDEGFEEWGGLQVSGGLIYGDQGNGCIGFGVYNIGANSWAELPNTPEVQEEGPVLGSALDPVTDTYLAYGPYRGDSLFRYDIEGNAWTISTLPFQGEKPINDGGMAYVSLPGIEGVYMVQGEEGDQFIRYNEANVTDLAPSVAASVVRTKTGAKITYSIAVKNNGPERASGINLADALPAGSSLLAVTPSQGTCSGTTCAFGVLKSGASAGLTVEVAVPAGTLTNTATVSSLATDTNPSNDTATAVTKVPSPCKVPKLKGKKTKAAKKALRKAHCAPGKVKHVFNAKVKKGKVVKGGKPGTALISGTKVKLVVSKGAKPKKAHHKK